MHSLYAYDQRLEMSISSRSGVLAWLLSFLCNCTWGASQTNFSLFMEERSDQRSSFYWTLGSWAVSWRKRGRSPSCQTPLSEWSIARGGGEQLKEVMSRCFWKEWALSLMLMREVKIYMEKLHSSSLVNEHLEIVTQGRRLQPRVPAFLCVLMESWNGVHFLLSLKRIVKGKTEQKQTLWTKRICGTLRYSAFESCLRSSPLLQERAGNLSRRWLHELGRWPAVVSMRTGVTIPRTLIKLSGVTQAQCSYGEMACEDKRFSLEVCGPPLVWHMQQETLPEIRFRVGA